MNKLAILLGTATLFAHAGQASVKPDAFIIAAYEEGRRSIILDVIESNGKWELAER